ncbi:MAG: CapA family protein [Bryobacteraceae bacterium]
MLSRRHLLAGASAALIAGCQNPAPEQRQQEPPPPPPTTRLLFGGDVMLSRHVGRLARMHKDPAFSFRDLAHTLAEADIAFINLESPFSDRGRPVEKGMIFKAEPEMIEGLQLAGIDVVSTSNNHSRDRAGYGILFTLDWLQKHGISAVGTGRTAEEAHAGTVVERNGIRFGFLAYTYDQRNGNYPDDDDRVAVLDAVRAAEDIASIKRRSDVVIVSMHAGEEYHRKPSSRQVSFARSAIDGGATLVIGHHPHVVQTVEQYKGGVIFYSLGNLVFDQFHRKDTQEGLLAEAIFIGKDLAAHSVKQVEIRRTVPRLKQVEGCT